MEVLEKGDCMILVKLVKPLACKDIGSRLNLESELNQDSLLQKQKIKAGMT